MSSISQQRPLILLTRRSSPFIFQQNHVYRADCRIQSESTPYRASISTQRQTELELDQNKTKQNKVNAKKPRPKLQYNRLYPYFYTNAETGTDELPHAEFTHAQ